MGRPKKTNAASHQEPSSSGLLAAFRIALCLLLAAWPAWGETPRLRLDHITPQDGLSHPLVFSIAQDDLGFLWFGTRDGLNRYDGYTFQVFRHDTDNPTSLSENSVRKVFVDSQGHLWVGTDGGGLNQYLPAEERFLRYQHDPQDVTTLSHDTIWAVAEDRSGGLWIGTEDGLSLLDRKTGKFTRYQYSEASPGGLPNRRVMALAGGPEGDLWLGLEAGGLSRFDNETETFHSYPLPQVLRGSGLGTVLTLVFDKHEALWIGTDNGFGHLPRGETEVMVPNVEGGGVVFRLLPDRKGNVWVGSFTNGLGRFVPKTGRLTMFDQDPTDPNSPNSDSIFTLFEDRAGSLWIGTRRGVAHLPRDRDQFSVYKYQTKDGGTVGHLVRGVYEDHRGTVWVGTSEGLTTLDRESQTLIPHDIQKGATSSLQGNAISAIREDHRRHLWAGLWFGGVVEIDATREHATLHVHDRSDPKSLCDDQVRAILQDRAQQLWFATYNGLCRFDFDEGRFVRYPTTAAEPAALGYGTFWTLLERRDGTLWLGSFEGLYRYDPESGRFDTFHFDSAVPGSLASNKILSLFEDSRERLWIGTEGGGLHQLDKTGRGFIHYRQRDGLAHDAVESILEDADGHLWLGTGGGLSRFDPTTQSFATYTVEDGLQGDIFSNSSALVGTNGELFFGGAGGLVEFAPDRLAPAPETAPVVITRLNLFHESTSRRQPSTLERSIVRTPEILLSWREDQLGLEFTALDYVRARRMQFEYRLEGFDRDWIATDSSRRYVQYSNLKPKRYQFHVRARSPRGEWRTETLNLVVQPPPWRTWWAYGFYLLSGSLALYGFVARQRRKFERERENNRQLVLLLDERNELITALEKRNVELHRFNHVVAHDLRNPLVTIRNFLGVLRTDFQQGRIQKLSDDLQHIDVAAEELESLLTSLDELSRLDSASLSDHVALSDVVREAMRSLEAEIRRTNAEIDVAEDLPIVRGDRIRLLELFCHLLGNALKFTRSTARPRIEIGVRRDGDRDVIFLRDNGLGIEETYQRKVFKLFERLDPAVAGNGIGLALVQRIVELHGGKVWVESEGRNRGSTFCFVLAP